MLMVSLPGFGGRSGVTLSTEPDRDRPSFRSRSSAVGYVARRPDLDRRHCRLRGGDRLRDLGSRL